MASPWGTTDAQRRSTVCHYVWSGATVIGEDPDTILLWIVCLIGNFQTE